MPVCVKPVVSCRFAGSSERTVFDRVFDEVCAGGPPISIEPFFRPPGKRQKMDLADRYAVESSGKGHPCGHGCGYLPARDWKAPPRRRIKSACGLEKSPALWPMPSVGTALGSTTSKMTRSASPVTSTKSSPASRGCVRAPERRLGSPRHVPAAALAPRR